MHDHGGRGAPARPPRRRWWPYLAVGACRGGGDNSDGVASLGGGKATATTSPGGSSDPRQGALAHGRCMRQHGMNIPDPKPDGGIQVHGAKGVGPDDPKFQAAQQACQQQSGYGDGA